MGKVSPLLTIHTLKTYFFQSGSIIKAVDGVNLSIGKGKILGLVGESGCGKTVLALSIIRLVPEPPGKIVSGEVIFKGKNLLRLNMKEIRSVRGNEISMIFQEPMTSLNPVYTIGEQISETIRLHQRLNRRLAKERSIHLLDKVGIPDPAKRYNDYPHQMSGGMRQRVMIAMALSCQPSLLIADEPTTALDVTIQAQILELIESLKMHYNMSIMLVSHDLGLIAEIAQKVCVMYAGHIVEDTDVESLFYHPLHPYTTGLLQSLPNLKKRHAQGGRLAAIPGVVPDLSETFAGCPFSPRCRIAKQVCREHAPEMREIMPGHFVSCWEAEKGG